MMDDAEQLGQEFSPTQPVQGTQDSEWDDGEELIMQDEDQEHRAWGRLVHTEDSAMCGKSYDLQDKEYSIGRAAKSSFMFDDPSVSSLHCVIYREGNTVFIKDCGSANGTFLESKRLYKHRPQELYHGSVVALVRPKSTDKRVKNWFQFRFESFLNPRSAMNPPQFSSQQLMQMQQQQQQQQQPIPDSLAGLRCDAFSQKYMVKEQLGSGAHAYVYRVVSRMNGESFAVKIIPRKLFRLHGKGEWKNQKREVYIMQQLAHPGIVRLFDVYETEDALFLVMELVQGGDLYDRIEQGTYTVDAARRLIINLLQAVDYLHEKDIIHRDLKPENILLKSKGDDYSIKLADFGIARQVRGGRATVCGTRMYCAPEVLERQNTLHGLGRYGKAADMWSVGVVVYVLLFGRFPFGNNDSRPISLLVKAMTQKQEWQNIPISVQDFILSLLDIDEHRRPTARQALNHPWLQATSTTSQSSSCSTISSSSMSTVPAALSRPFIPPAVLQDVNINTPVHQHKRRKVQPMSESPMDQGQQPHGDDFNREASLF